MGNSVKSTVFTQIGRLPWQKRKVGSSNNKHLNQIGFYSNNHIICIIYAKLKNIELLPFSSEKYNALYFTNVLESKQE